MRLLTVGIMGSKYYLDADVIVEIPLDRGSVVGLADHMSLRVNVSSRESEVILRLLQF